MKQSKLYIGCALVVAAFGAQAADPGWFGGIRIQSRGIEAPAAEQALDPDVNLSFFSIPIRLKLGMDVGLRDAQPVDAGTGLRLGDDRMSWQVLGVGSVPLSKNWGLFGKLGAYRWSPDFTSSFAGIGASSPQPTYGLGLKYNFTSNLSVSGEWDRYQVNPSNGLRPDGEIDLLSIGLKYRF